MSEIHHDKYETSESTTAGWVRRFTLLMVSAWTAINLFSLGVECYDEWVFARHLAVNAARTHFDLNLAIRQWATNHGGVYVPIDDRTPPNELLAKIPERDITTPSGRKLTLMNPAYMMRQLNEDFAETYGIAGHITSLKPLRALNAPDAWEQRALETFERGNKEVFEFTTLRNEDYVRLMRPVNVQLGCLKCHRHQGYKEGDVRGGISVSVPLKRYYASMWTAIEWQLVVHISIWFIGLLGIFLFRRSLGVQFAKRASAEQALAKSEKRITDIINAVDEGIVAFGESGEVVFVNGAVKTIFGYSQEELIGRKIGMFFAKTGESDYDGAYEILRNLYSSFNGNFKGRTAEIEGRKKSGDTFPIELKVQETVLAAESKPIFTAVIRDLTRVKAAEQERIRLIKAIEHTAEAVVLTDMGGNIMYVNPAFEKLTGYNREEAVGNNVSMLKSGRHDKEYYRRLWETISSGRVWEGRFINKRKDGSLYDDQSIITPVMDSAHHISGYVALKRDVTREAALSRAKEFFISATSHELRTPLAKLGLVEMLMAGIRSNQNDISQIDKCQEVLDDAMRNIERVVGATTLISDLVSSVRKDLHPVRVKSTLSGVYEATKIGMEKAGRKVNIVMDLREMPDGLIILGDEKMIHTVLEEVLSNAIKYTPDGNDVHLTARIPQSQQKMLAVEVKDEGVGIKPEVADLVFEPFFSLEDPMKHSTGKYKFRGGGVGLGLTMSRMIMEYHGGMITGYSAGETMGSTFVLTFPIP